MKIMLVDDQSANLDLLRILMESQQHTTVLAANGQEALQKAQEARPDLIISDILMPVMDGFALCRAWMKDPNLRSVPFVFYTATYQTEEDEALGRSLGATEFLHKPMEPEAFIAQIQRVLNRADAVAFKPPPSLDLGEASFLKLYNERLVQKLDQRHADLAHQFAILQETEVQLRLKGAALEAAVNGVMITDRDGSILWTNPAFQAMTGYRSEELLGASPAILKPSAHDPAFYARMWSTILAGTPWDEEVVSTRKDGALRTFRVAITPILNDQGEPTHFITICHDVTDQKRTELELRQAQKMDAVGRLAGGVAHDFNNMLNVIFMDVELLLLRDDLSEAQRRPVLEIQEAARRSAGYTRQLLTLSRKEPAKPRVLTLNSVVEENQKMFQRLIGGDIELAFSPGADLWSVLMDPSQISQILMNLVINARDAMAEPGVIRIRTENIELDDSVYQNRELLPPGAYVLLSVSDPGSGMDHHTLEQIFDPFFTTKKEGSGTGLGLSTVYGIVRQNGGAITAYSQPGFGTTMKVYLPRWTGPSQAPERTAAVLPRGTETLVLAEDEDAILITVKRALEGLGYQVLTAASSKELVQLAADYAAPIHLLLSDVVMPGLNGKELMDLLAQTRPGIKVIFMSGYVGDIIANRGFLDPETNFLQKPFRILDLARKVREVLDSAPARSYPG